MDQRIQFYMKGKKLIICFLVMLLSLNSLAGLAVPSNGRNGYIVRNGKMLGINTTRPRSALQIDNATALFSNGGNFIFLNGSGLVIDEDFDSNGYILVSDKNGKAYWQNPNNLELMLSNLVLGNLTVSNNAFFTNTSNIDINGELIFRPGAENGYVLISDANGLASWVNLDTLDVNSPWIENAGNVYLQDANGNVAIGKNSAEAKLDVYGEIPVPAEYVLQEDFSSGTAGVFTVTSGSFSFGSGYASTSGNSRMETSVTVGANGATLSYDLNALDDYCVIEVRVNGALRATYSGPNLGVPPHLPNSWTTYTLSLNPGANTIEFRAYYDGDGSEVGVDNVEVFQNASGDLIYSALFDAYTGFNIRTPSAMAHVNGEMAFKYTDGNQANGYVLTSDANGSASWISAGSLSGIGDNLGDHVATQNLDLANFDIINGGAAVFNESADPANDFRIETENQSHMFYVQSDDNRIGISTDSPAAALSIGTTTADFISGTNGLLVEGDAEFDGVVYGVQFNGGIFNGTFVGDGSGLTGLAGSSNGIEGSIQFSDGAGGFDSSAPDLFWNDNGKFALIGNGALSSTAIGQNAALLNIGRQVIALGQSAASLNQGDHLIAIGNGAGINVKGDNNIAIGQNSLYGTSGARGNGNIAIGRTTLDQVVNGNYNIAIGDGAGSNLSNGERNIFIGYNAEPPNAGDNGSFMINIGNTIYGNSSTGTVAIGAATANPRADLELVGTFLYEDGNQADGFILTSDANGLAQWSNVDSLSVPGIFQRSGGLVSYSNADFADFQISGNGVSSLFYVESDTNGGVGVGINTPNSLLDVAGPMTLRKQVGGTNAAPTFLSLSTNGENISSALTGTAVVGSDKPSGAGDEDVLLAFVRVVSADSIATPSGWTLVNSTGSDYSIFYRLLDSSDTSVTEYNFDVNVTAGSNKRVTIVISAFEGVDQLNPIDSSAVSTSSWVTAPALTTSVDHTILARYAAHNDEDNSNYTSAPTGHGNFSSGTFYDNWGFATKTLSTAGAEPSADFIRAGSSSGDGFFPRQTATVALSGIRSGYGNITNVTDSVVIYQADNGNPYGSDGSLMARIDSDGVVKNFVLADFNNGVVGTPGGGSDNLGDHIATQNLDLANFDIINGGAAVFNENGDATNDFRIESENQTHMFFVQSDDNRIGITTDSPGAALSVGTTTADFIDGTNGVLVAGDVEVDGRAYFNGLSLTTGFANGFVLTSDPAGNASWQNLDSLVSASSDIFTLQSNIISNNGEAADYANDFVIGSPSLDQDGITAHDSRMFFDKSQSAFRVGAAESTQWDTAQVGQYSTAFGFNPTANGMYATAFGFDTLAEGQGSTAFGSDSLAKGMAATAFGGQSSANGDLSTAFGYQTDARGDYSTASGYQSIANGEYATSFGASAEAIGTGSTAFGWISQANGDYATTWGHGTQALGSYATAFGDHSEARGYGATSWGSYSSALAQYSTAWGITSQANGDYATAFGNTTVAAGDQAVAFGEQVTASGNGTIAMGRYATTTGLNSVVLGYGNSNTDRLTNTGPNTMSIGFNSNTATLFIGASAGGSTTGNVGIGTSSPQASLDINGNIAIRDGNQSNGYILTSDNNGIATWTPAGVVIGASDTLGNHTADQDLDMNGWSLVNVKNITANGDITTTGDVTAAFFYGNGRNLVGVPGDDLGDHQADTNLNMAGNDINNVATITAVEFNGGGFYGTFYGDGSNLTGINATDDLGNHTAEQALNMAGYDIINVNNITATTFTGGTFSGTFTGDGSGLTGIDGADDLGNHTAEQPLNMAGNNITNVDDITAVSFTGGSFTGDGSGLTGTGDDLGNHTATENLDLANFDIENLGAVVVNEAGNSANDFRVESSGKDHIIYVSANDDYVGIDTNSPAALLDIANGTADFVDGADDVLIGEDLEVDGKIYANGFALTKDPTAGFVLTTDGAGNASWGNLSTLGAASNIFIVQGNVVNNNGDAAGLDKDFVFGSLTLDDAGETSHDNRFFFDKSLGAFRAGRATGNDWNEANLGAGSFAGGDSTIARGTQATAFGFSTAANGNYATALGYETAADGISSFAGGDNSIARGLQAFSYGFSSAANGNYSVAMGYLASANGIAAIALGDRASATGLRSLASGYFALANGQYATALGHQAKAIGNSSFATGDDTAANGAYSIAMGAQTAANAIYSFASGFKSIANGNSSVALGRSSAYGDYSFAVGLSSSAHGNASIALGDAALTSNGYAIALGSTSQAMGEYSITIGQYTGAYKDGGLAMGRYLTSTENGSMTIGVGNGASDRLTNVTENSLIVAYNTNAATLFVGPGSGGSSNGNVGINTTVPTQSLDINGQVRIRGGGPQTGFVLTSDAAGVASWQDLNSLSANGDDLGNHTATENLDMANFDIENLGAVVVNEEGNSTNDFRVESSGKDHIIYVSANDDFIGIDTNSPAALMDIGNGTLDFTNVELLVKNNVEIDGRLYTNGLTLNKDAVDGYVLATDGAGNASWQDLSSLGSNGDDLGNHTATESLKMATQDIENVGKIAIGANTAESVLEATGRMRALASAPGSPSAGQGVEMFFVESSAEGAINSYDRANSSYEHLRINAAPLVLNDASGANVGIGDATPDAKLDVNGDAIVAATLYANMFNGDGSQIKNVPGFFAESGGQVTYRDQTQFFDFKIDANGEANIFYVRTEEGNGGIGIGVENPDSKLDVDGGITFRERNAEVSAAILYGGRSTNSYSGSTGTVAKPAGTLTGDLLVLFHRSFGSQYLDTGATTPAWTAYSAANLAYSSRNIRVYYRFANGDDAAISNYNMTNTTTGSGEYSIARYRNANSSTPFSNLVTSSDGAARYVSPGTNTTYENSIAVRMVSWRECCGDDGENHVSGCPASHTYLAGVTGDSGARACSVPIANSGVGTVPSVEFPGTNSSGGSSLVTFVINPAAEADSDPNEPDDGATVLWMADPTSFTGNQGDILVRINGPSGTKTIKLVDYENGTLGAAGSVTGGGADDLGNHTATQALNMSNFNINNIGAAVVNEAGGSNDFRVEGSSDTHLFFTQASTNRVGVSSNAPEADLSVGNATADFIDGTDDLIVADDIEVDGTVYGTFVGDGSGLTGISTGSDIFVVNSDIISNNGSAADYADAFVIGSPSLNDTGNVLQDSRMFFDRQRGAFRAGEVNSDEWDLANRGLYSAAFNRGTRANGDSASAFGAWTTASGLQSSAFGFQTDASGTKSMAWGDVAQATGTGATAFGTSTDARGDYATAWGYYSAANGDYATAFGYSTHATGNYSTAFGGYSIANNTYSYAIGAYGNESYGQYSGAIGNFTVVPFGVDYSIVIGKGVNSVTPLVAPSYDDSLSIGFNSTIPTVFVAPGEGAGTYGEVGIGTTTPTEILDITNGNIRYRTGAQDGYVLTSNATGVASWQDLGSLAANGDNLGNHEATQNLDMMGLDIENVGHIDVNTSSPNPSASIDAEGWAIIGDGALGVVAIGNGAAASNTGTKVVGLGFNAAMNNDSQDVVAIGDRAGRDNENYAVNLIGSYVGMYNNGGTVNAMGYYSAYRNLGSVVNALGFWSANDNEGNNVNAFGSYSAGDNTGDEVNAIGNFAAQYNDGHYVTAIGHDAAQYSNGGYTNAIGYSSGMYNNGQYVNAIGYATAYANDGEFVDAIGYSAAYNNSGDYVTALGRNAALNNTGNFVHAAGWLTGQNNTGDYNIFIGYQAGDSHTSGSNGIILGRDAEAASPSADGQLSIGNTIYGNLENKEIVIGLAKADPDATLEVNGSFLLRDGSQVDGYVLASDAAGLASWVSPASLSGVSEFTDAGTFLRPADSSGAEDIVLGATSIASADMILSANGGAHFNKQRVSGATFEVSTVQNAHTLFVQGATSRIGVNADSPSADLDIGGGIADFVDGTHDLLVKDDLEVDDTVYATNVQAGNGNFSYVNAADKVLIDTTNGGTYALYVNGSSAVGAVGTRMAVQTITDAGFADFVTTSRGTGHQIINKWAVGSTANNRPAGNGGPNTFYIFQHTDQNDNANENYRFSIKDNGYVGINGFTASALLDVGMGTANNIDGHDDLLVADDLEVDGYIYGNGRYLVGVSGSVTSLDDLTDANYNQATNGNFGLGLNTNTAASVQGRLVSVGTFANQNASPTTSTSGGTNNTAVGYEANRYVTTGSSNVAVGRAANRDSAGVSAHNTVIGNFALGDVQNSGGTNVNVENVVIGSSAATVNANNIEQNVFIGNRTGYYTDGADRNVAVGYEALYSLESFSKPGNGNIAVGYRAGRYMEGGDRNIVIGYGVDVQNTFSGNFTGSDNIIIGTGSAYQTSQLGSSTSNKVIIADLLDGYSDILGAGSMTVRGDLIAGTTSSDNNRFHYDLSQRAMKWGYRPDATGEYSTAFGYDTNGNAYASTAFGYETKAGGFASLAYGNGSRAWGRIATAFGNGSVAESDGGIAFGHYARAVGENTIAIGSGLGSFGQAMQVLTDDTFGVGFQSTVPTLVVTAASGAVDSIGRVGIGTSTPQEMLHVTGNLRVDGEIIGDTQDITSTCTMNNDGMTKYSGGKLFFCNGENLSFESVPAETFHEGTTLVKIINNTSQYTNTTATFDYSHGFSTSDYDIFATVAINAVKGTFSSASTKAHAYIDNDDANGIVTASTVGVTVVAPANASIEGFVVTIHAVPKGATTIPSETYSWNTTSGTCELLSHGYRTVYCERDSDSAPVGDAFCSGSKPTGASCNVCSGRSGQYLSGISGRQKNAANNSVITGLGDPSSQNFFWGVNGLPTRATSGNSDNYVRDLTTADKVCQDTFGTTSISVDSSLANLYEHTAASPGDNDQWRWTGSVWTEHVAGAGGYITYIKGLDCICD